jgi:hypothetical protein
MVSVNKRKIIRKDIAKLNAVEADMRKMTKSDKLQDKIADTKDKYVVDEYRVKSYVVPRHLRRYPRINRKK